MKIILVIQIYLINKRILIIIKYELVELEIGNKINLIH